jgi:CRISPR/Cas system-associated exonuclease Cas4 (RecB family)
MIAADRRPDRVIATLDKHEAIVIDYKTGTEHARKYERQVSFYMNLLRRMGYQSVQGFIWYILEDKIEEVQL